MMIWFYPKYLFMYRSELIECAISFVDSTYSEA